MKANLQRAVFAILASCGICPAFAQDTSITSVTVGTCNLSGSVKVTVLGVVTTAALPCVNPTGVNAPGMDQDELAGTTTLGVPAVANVATVSAPKGESAYGNLAIGTTTLLGYETLDYASAMQGQIVTGGMAGGIVCDSSGGTITCGAATGVASLQVGGQTVVLPSDPIPLNYTIPIANLSLAVNVLGVGLLNIPVSGNIVLNKVSVTGTSTHPLIHHALFQASLAGSVSVLGLGLVSVEATVVDDTMQELAALFPHVTLIDTEQPRDVCARGVFLSTFFSQPSAVCPP